MQVELTKRQELALRAISNGSNSELAISTDVQSIAWPRGVRRVTGDLQRKGLVTRGRFDRDEGYEFEMTPLGVEVEHEYYGAEMDRLDAQDRDLQARHEAGDRRG